MVKAWKFALPPQAHQDASHVARVRTALSTIGCADVKAELTYALLLDHIMEGTVQAAWAPPLLCAKVERLGGRVLLRAKRGGTGTYRSVLFARADRRLTLDTLEGATAAWLDTRSMSGYVLPRALFRKAGLSPERLFAKEKFLGSYAACINAVLDGKVDVSATYASSEKANVQRIGYVETMPARAGELIALAYSPECPHDGIVLSPRVTGKDIGEYAAAFQALLRDPLPTKALLDALEVEGFETPPTASYARMATDFALDSPELAA